MAIVKMEKFSFLTFENYKKDLLKQLQIFGEVHFKNLQEDEMAELEFLKKDSTEATSHLEYELANVKFALNKLEPFVDKPKGLKAMTIPPETLAYDVFDNYTATYDYNRVYEQIKEQDEKINTAKSEVTKLLAENDSLKTWNKLDVSPQQLNKLKSTANFIGTVSKLILDNFVKQVEEQYSTAYIELIGYIKEDAAVLILAPSEISDDILSFCKTLGFSKLSLNFTGVPAEIVTENQKKISRLKKEQLDAQHIITGLAGEYSKLQIVYDYLETTLTRERTCENFLKTKQMVIIDGFYPATESDKLIKIIESVCGKDYFIEQIAVEKDSTEVPIKLKNNKFFAAFEGVTEMYSMPKYNEIDPTPFLAPFYFVFFGLMIGDAGYGLLMLIATALALKLFALKDGTKKFLEFFFFLSFAVIMAGFIYGSFFGFPFFRIIETDTGSKAIMDTQLDIIGMMIMSVAIGIFQILFGLGVKGYVLARDKRYFAAIFDSVFWIITIVSAIGLILSFMTEGLLPDNIASLSQLTFVLGCIGLALTQGREAASLGGKIASGLYSVYGLANYVGDVVSYTRIAALALSGSFIGYSFILMIDLLPNAFAKAIFGTIIFLAGLALNLGLSALGAYVHSCRLQYVEYFSKFYEGGGVPFAPFKLNNKHINIKKNN